MGDFVFEVLIHSLMIIVYLYAMFLSYILIRKLYGGRFTNALPYLMIAVSLIFGLIVMHAIDVFIPVLDGSEVYLQGSQVLQLVAGIFFMKALYEIYQARFSTEGFISQSIKGFGGKK